MKIITPNIVFKLNSLEEMSFFLETNSFGKHLEHFSSAGKMYLQFLHV